MYESPIETILGELQTQMIYEEENMVMQAVRNISINVDKKELIKALQYDRNQYDKGYADGKNDVLNQIREEIEVLRYSQPFRRYIVDEFLDIINKYREGRNNECI